MGKSYESNGNGYHVDPGNLQIIRHPSYNLSSRLSSSLWFDIRVFYVRISNLSVDDSTPECLTLNHIPLSPDTVLEVNGLRCSTDSEGISCTLRRDRVDKKSEEATFVSTDSMRSTGSVRFEVFNGNDLLISGVLEMCNTNGNAEEQNNNVGKRWIMDCESINSSAMGFLKGKQIMGSESSLPMIEVCVAGCISGSPIILTKTLQINHRKKQRKGMLDSIPEYNSGSHQDVSSIHDFQVSEYKNYKPESEEEYDNKLYWRETEYAEDEDGELSWFNAGVRVGVGIGLGICLGLGIGVSLLVRTYQSTTRTFKRTLV